MDTAKSRMIRVAIAGMMASSSMALDVGFNPDTVYFLSRVAVDNFEQEEVFYPDADGGNVVLSNHGVALNSSLEVIREADVTQVLLSTSMAFAAEGNTGLAEFSGEFQTSEPAYVQFFGQMSGDSISPDAVCFLYAAQSSLDGALPAYEYEYQYGLAPEMIAINGQTDGVGFLEGAIHEPQLLPAGTYFFVIQLLAWDGAVTADTVFGCNGVAGFTVTAADAQAEEPATLDDLLGAIEEYAADGEIHPGVANALSAKVKEAIRAEEQGRDEEGALRPFLNHLQAQAGKKIGEAAAAGLLELVTEILEN